MASLGAACARRRKEGERVGENSCGRAAPKPQRDDGWLLDWHGTCYYSLFVWLA